MPTPRKEGRRAAASPLPRLTPIPADKPPKKFHRIYTTHDPAAPPEMATGWMCWYMIDTPGGPKTFGTWHANEGDAEVAARALADFPHTKRIAVCPTGNSNPFGTRIPSVFRLSRDGKLTAEAIAILKADSDADEARKEARYAEAQNRRAA